MVLRLVDLGTGAERWHIDIGSNHLAFNSSDAKFYCVAAPLDNPQDTSLIRLAGTIFTTLTERHGDVTNRYDDRP